jgi:hypothetical protein
MRNFISPQIFLLLCTLVLLGQRITAQTTAETMGRTVLEAIQTGDFAKLEAIMPSEAAIALLITQEDAEHASERPEKGPADVRAQMREKMQAELKDVLQSAKTHRVKLSKLSFGSILRETANDEAPISMKGVDMQLFYKNKPLNVAFSMVEMDGKWYYLGILRSYDLFKQLD